MAIKFLNVDALPAFLAACAKDARVIAPVKTGGVVQFQPLGASDAVELDVLLAKQSPKEWLFPQTETYLTFEYGKETRCQRRRARRPKSGADAPVPTPTVTLRPRTKPRPSNLRLTALRRPAAWCRWTRCSAGTVASTTIRCITPAAPPPRWSRSRAPSRAAPAFAPHWAVARPAPRV